MIRTNLLVKRTANRFLFILENWTPEMIPFFFWNTYIEMTLHPIYSSSVTSTTASYCRFSSEQPAEQRYFPSQERLKHLTIVFWNLNCLKVFFYKFTTVVVVSCPLNIFSPITTKLPVKLMVEIGFSVRWSSSKVSPS